MRTSLGTFYLLSFAHWIKAAVKWRILLRMGWAELGYKRHAAAVAAWAKASIAKWRRITFKEVAA